jgi:hypothetical protein
VPGNGFCGIQDKREIGISVGIQGSGDTNQNDIHLAKSLKIGGCPELFFSQIRPQVLCSDMLDVTFITVQQIDFFLINIKTDNMEANIQKCLDQRQPHIA